MENTKITFGKYKGISYKECLETHPAYCEWATHCRVYRKGSSFSKFKNFLVDYYKKKKSESVDISDEVNAVNIVQIQHTIKIHHCGCYLIQLQQDIIANNNVYKVGRSNDLLKRLNSTEYKKARIISVRGLEDSINCEKEIIQTFDSLFKPIKRSIIGSTGNEYFEGDIKMMRAIFEVICNKYEL